MADLATTQDLVDRLGRALTAAEAQKAPAMLSDASSLLRAFTRRDFEPNTDESVILRPVGNLLRLPHKPVTGVDRVERIGTSGTADRVLAVDEWEFDGIDTIALHVVFTETDVIGSGSYADTFRVVYDNGGVIPDFIVGRCATMVLRALLAPTQAAGLVQERIGQYAYQYGQAPGQASPGPTVVMTDDDRKALREAGYRAAGSTIQLRM